MGKNNKIRAFGVNDADYEIQTTTFKCPYYRKWDMTVRRFHKKSRPIYEPWMSFMNFRQYLLDIEWDGEAIAYTKPHMHPDYLILTNNSQAISGLFAEHAGVYPAHQKGNKWVAHLFNKYLGTFKTKELAKSAYTTARDKARQELLNGNT